VIIDRHGHYTTAPKSPRGMAQPADHWIKDPSAKAMLDRTQRVANVILTTSNNTAWTEDGFRASWGKACTKADIPDDLTFHDIRGVGRDAPGRGRVRGTRNRDQHGALAQGR